MDKRKFINSFFSGTFALVSGLLFFLCLGYGALEAKGSLSVKNSVFSQPLNSQYKKFLGEIMLPAQGYWRMVRTNQAENITEIYLVPSTPMSDEEMGGRVAAVIEKKQIQKGQYFLSQFIWPCTNYAKKHNNIGPSSLEDLDDEKYKYLLKSLSRSPFDKIKGGEVEGPFVFLVPEVTFHFEKKGEYVLAKNKEVLAWELRPYVDDGKHWVLYTDGSCIRQPIDTRLMKKYQQVIRPVKRKKKETTKKMPDERSYSIAAVCKEMPKIALLITLENVYSGETIEIQWDMNKARQLERGKSVDLKGVRTTAWLSYARLSHSPIMTTWLFTLDKKKKIDLFPHSRRQPRETLSVFDILGGRAAVRETLQLEVLNVSTEWDKKYDIAIESLEGVKVKSHPFREMLKKNSVKVKELPLANLAPHDHFFVYMANPRDILAFLNQGCEFLHRIGTTFTGNGIDYGLDKKYLQRLGFNKQLLRALLQAGSILECALIFPDLFFIDGTDVTVVSRLKRPGQVSALLTLIGLNELPPKGIITHKLKDGNSVYWSIWDDLLMVSTSKSELDKVLQLKANEGKGSLGQSEEFQYMLTQLPITESTWSYAYLSDPFIRHLVSPAAKIGQLRRIRARADMEFLTACALLARLDGMKSPWSIKNLVEYKYIPETYLEGDYYFNQNHILYSKTYGRLSNMKPLSQVPIDRVSRQEEKAYKRYVNVYSDYWRQFFDPIALRLDETADGFLEAEVFILPLVNNSFYNSLKAALKRKEDNTEFKIPKLSIDPIIMLSLNLGEEAWKGILKDFYNMLNRYMPLHPAIFEDFGPGLHLAVHDADPVIALGSGDILGAFGADFISVSGVGGSMLSLPVLLSVLTRPCTLVIETQNPQRTLNYLKQAVPAARTGRPDREFNVRVHQVEDRDQWVFSFNLAGLIKLRFSVELQDEFVLIRNIPWSHNEKIVSVDKTGLKSASLITYPDACDLQLPGLFEADQDRNLFIAFQGVGHLYPLVVSGYASIEDAAEKHEALFGFAPRHPGNGRFLWNNFHLESSTYGSVFYQLQPAYKKGDTNFGVMAGFQYLGVSMQFEDSGLRTKCRWKITW